ncbi:MAG: hypothetical protein PHG95_02705 [Patescibacteria group bacterium]|nr:hypothetical protein [Patescibacteria group bacterium]
MEITEELKTVNFYRLHMLMSPKIEDMPTLEDADEHKLPAINRLLIKMFEFNREMNSVGLSLQEEKGDHYHQKKLYELTDTRFKGPGVLRISITSKWFDPKYGIALHGGFKFHLYIDQRIHPEISDWLRIDICHLNTTPISFVSAREYDRYLTPPFYHGKHFFDGIEVGPKERNFATINDGLTFKITTFNQCVADACAVMQALIISKDSLVAIP